MTRGSFLGTFLFVALIPFSLAAKPTDKNQIPQNSRDSSLVTRYLVEDLGVQDPSEFNLVLQQRKRLDRVAPEGNPERQREVLLQYFSKQSAETLGELLSAFAANSYSNAIVLGQAGVGKTFLLNQVAAMFGFGVFPDYVGPEIGMDTNGNGVGSGAFELVRDAFLGKTDVVLVNVDLMSRDNTKDGKAFSSEPVRMRTVISQLFDAARREFQRVDAQGNRIGRRTIFVFDEVATLPDLVQPTLKKLLDATGFRNPNDPVRSLSDSGYAVLAMTTPDEYRQMVHGDSAVERRYHKISLSEASEQEAFEIVRMQADTEWTELYGLLIHDEAIRFLVRMSKFINSPPLAMPASVLRATNNLYTWRMRNGPRTEEITLRDAQNYFMTTAGLTDIWFDGPNGEAPFADFASRVKRLVVGQDQVVDKIADRLAAWARLGFGGDVPVFFLGGPSGSGKDTLLRALNQVLFGHDGRHLMFSIGGTVDFGINSIIEGPPLGNHSDSEQPLLIKALENGPDSGILAFNEVKDARSEELEKLKVFIETGEVRPKGQDSRVRPLRYPVFIMGQWGEELFVGKTDSEAAAAYAKLTQAQLEQYFLDGKEGRAYGAVSPALLERAKKSGGVFLLSPVERSKYASIVALHVKSLTEQQRARNAIELSVSEKLMEFIAQVSAKAGDTTRGLGATTIDFTETAISKSIDQGLPLRNVTVSVDHEKDAASGRDLVVVRRNNAPAGARSEWKFEASTLRRIKNTCEDLLKP